MENLTRILWTFFIFLSLTYQQLKAARILHIIPDFNYTLTTMLVNSSLASDPVFQRIGKKTFITRTPYFKDYLDKLSSKMFPAKTVESVNNLYSTLKPFTNSNCLIAINNFNGIDIIPEILYPAILRKFQLAFLQISYIDRAKNKSKWETSLTWIPQNIVTQSNGNFSTSTKWFSQDDNTFRHNCPVSKYFAPILIGYPRDFCVQLEIQRFLVASKPWNCELQVDLFVPDDLLRLEKYTKIFSNQDVTFKSLPSLRPRVQFLINLETKIQEYDPFSLAAWILKTSIRFNQERMLQYEIINDVTLIAYMACHSKNILVRWQCHITTLRLVYACFDCKTLVTKIPIHPTQISFQTIFKLERSQKSEVFPVEHSGEAASFNLASDITYFVNKGPKAVEHPLEKLRKLEKKYFEKTELLAFGYASVFIHMIGNFSDSIRNPYYRPGTFAMMNIVRKFDFDEKDDVGYDYVLKIINEFGKLHFVSCGSRGVEAFPFSQFLSVFEWEVWLFLVVSVLVFSNSITLLTRISSRTFSFSSSVLSVVKVLLEQGDPFPEGLNKFQKFRFLMSGIFSAGLVLSNAFKSENVYKIVMPRGYIPYDYIEELIENNFTAYSRIQNFEYRYGATFYGDFVHTETKIYGNFENSIVNAFVELFYSPWDTINSIPKYTKIRNYSRMHPKVVENFFEPARYANDFYKFFNKQGPFRSGAIRNFLNGKVLREHFRRKQEKVIRKGLENCTKIAWVLPNYLAQITRRNLRKLGKHSDVSIDAFSQPEIALTFSSSYVPTIILQQYGRISTSGLIDWWPRFLNRSDLDSRKQRVDITKPNMTGNILVIFVFLGGGIAAAVGCMAVEFCFHKLRIWKAKKKPFNGVQYNCVSKCCRTRNKCRDNVIVIDVKSFDMVP